MTTENTSQNKHKKLGEIFNRTRLIQGWSLMTPADTVPIVREWFEQFERYQVPLDLYDQLLQWAIDHRANEIRDNKKPTPFSADLLLAMFNAPETVRVPPWKQEMLDCTLCGDDGLTPESKELCYHGKKGA